MRVLVVEDEKKVCDFIRQALEEDRYAVDQALDGEQGLDLAESSDYDLVVLDWMLPKKSGHEVLKQLRARDSGTPVLILTARDAVQDKVMMLDSGADDYLAKPFSIEEFLARVRVLLRRRIPSRGAVLRIRDLTLDPATRHVHRGDRAIELTNKEFALLQYMMRNRGRVLPRTAIAEHVWNLNYDNESNVIDVYVTYLRNKIDRGEPSKLIKTVRGVGYMIGD